MFNVKFYYCLLFFVFIFFAAVTAQQRKALFVIVDGIPADVIEKLSTPALDSIAKEGFYTRAYVGGEKGGYSETPTISAVGYNSLLTGTWVNKHNVWGNDIKSPNFHYPSIFNLFWKQQPQKKMAIFSSWLDNRTKLIGENLPEAGGFKLNYHFDGLELDTLRFPHDKQREYMHLIDEEVVNTATSYIKKEAPDLSWIYLEYTDDMGHMYGDSEPFYKAVETMDNQIGRVWEAIEYRRKAYNEEWVIYITTDHGRDAKTGKSHGGQSDRERNTWIVSNAKFSMNILKNYKPGIVDIMPSIAVFLNIKIPKEQQMEIDGVPLTKGVSAVSPKASFENQKIKVEWEAINRKGKAKLWIATSNNYKDGGSDIYHLLKRVPVKKEGAVLDVKNMPSSFYKIVIEMPGNILNRWLIINDQKQN